MELIKHSRGLDRVLTIWSKTGRMDQIGTQNQ